MVIDNTVTQATLMPKSITCQLNGRLEDLNYADDICLLPHKFDDARSKLEDVAAEAAICDFKINVPKK